MRIGFLSVVIFGWLTVRLIVGQEAQNQRGSRQQRAVPQFVFSVRGVGFSADQQIKIEELGDTNEGAQKGWITRPSAGSNRNGHAHPASI